MTLLTLLMYIAIAAGVVTVVIGLLKKGHKSWLMTFLQNFTGILFIVSGFVKAIDPVGTAYKMEQYFTEFQYTFADSALSFMAPLFPFLSSISLVFSVVMIVFEIVLGIMLLLGHRPKLTSWLFLLLVIFFTILTGFTFLTGYVPSDGNFFKFSTWGPYAATNMRVTDCGCFGDFIKLEPKISFFKDLVLLLPALFFVFRHKDMHQLFSARARNIIVAASTVLITIFCLNNFLWNLPVVDFRPFKVGTNLYEKKKAEEESAASVKILTMTFQNNTTKEIIELPYEVYMKEFAKYPKTEWTKISQTQSEPPIPETKVSHFSFIDPEGTDVAEDILTDSGHVFLVIAYHLKGESSTQEVIIPDTTWTMDTVLVNGQDTQLIKNIAAINTQRGSTEVYVWDADYLNKFKVRVNPLMEDVMKQGAKVYAAAGGSGTEKLAAFKQASGSQFNWYEADDILLKTIIRSNPGVVHLKGGKVIEMWHIRNLPKTLPLQ
ncbi:MAG: DoxX family protein [Bacteroidota bacterium]|nr:DoxX family protein [Bacteroidota bacterium]